MNAYGTHRNVHDDRNFGRSRLVKAYLYPPAQPARCRHSPTPSEICDGAISKQPINEYVFVTSPRDAPARSRLIPTCAARNSAV